MYYFSDTRCENSPAKVLRGGSRKFCFLAKMAASGARNFSNRQIYFYIHIHICLYIYICIYVEIYAFIQICIFVLHLVYLLGGRLHKGWPALPAPHRSGAVFGGHRRGVSGGRGAARGNPRRGKVAACCLHVFHVFLNVPCWPAGV